MMAQALLAGCAASAFAASILLPAPRASLLDAPSQGAPPDLLGHARECLGRAAPMRATLERAERSRRRAVMLRQLPGMLDVVTLGLSAGLSFDAALELYCSRAVGELSCALREAMLTWRIGAKSRADALDDLAREAGVQALARFSQTVSQALAFGAPLAQALERQAEAVRDEQRSELEEQIEQLPVKMLIPLGTLIVPAMLLAILGPLLGSAIGIS